MVHVLLNPGLENLYIYIYITYITYIFQILDFKCVWYNSGVIKVIGSRWRGFRDSAGLLIASLAHSCLVLVQDVGAFFRRCR